MIDQANTPGNTPHSRPIRMAACVLRGLGQVMFQAHPLAGLLFLAGIAVNSWLLAGGALAGCIVSTLTAHLLGADRRQIGDGLFGFNGALVAIALLVFLAPTPLTFACVVLAAASSTILTMAMQTAFATWALPVLTAPFVFTALTLFLAVARFGRLTPTGNLPTASLPQQAVVEGVVTATTLGEGLLTGIGQVFFQANMASGALFAAGLLLASRRVFLLAVAGSLAGALVAWGMGAAEPDIRAGLWGFNSALTAIAIGATFLPAGWRVTIYAVLAAAVTPFVAAACGAALAPLGMPAMTLPFVLATWVFLLAGRSLPPR